MLGQTLSHYVILEKLGSGGMGEVYLAEDTTLHRKVALKVLPPIAASEERLLRFEREAHAVAALNHPNIVHVYSIEQAEGVHFITMERVEGQTLSQVIAEARRGLPLSELFEIAIPLADAVSAAHEKGITHRDLKPDNLMVNERGLLKILDFGLAKLKPHLAEEDIASLPTLPATQQGRILGTVSYMSPEQAEGKAVDERSDIFSIGIILYEMATGGRPFRGDSNASVLSSILKDTPAAVSEVNPDLPPRLGRIVRRCLTKDRERRFQTAKDLRNELEELKQDIESGEVEEVATAAMPTRRRPSSWTWLALAAIVLAVGVGLTYRLTRSTRGGQETVGPAVVESLQLTFDAGLERWPNLSPDGGFVVYGSRGDIYLQRVGGSKAISLTEDLEAEALQPALSPDGEEIAFRAQGEGGGLYVMGATGERVRRLTDFGFDPSWSPGGESILFTGGWQSGSRGPPNVGGSRQLWSARVATGEMTLLSEGQTLQPRWSPRQHRIAYWVGPGSGQTDIWTMSREGGDPKP